MAKKRFSFVRLEKDQYAQLLLLFRVKGQSFAAIQWLSKTKHDLSSPYSLLSFDQTSKVDLIPISSFIKAVCFHKSQLTVDRLYLNNFVQTLK